MDYDAWSRFSQLYLYFTLLQELLGGPRGGSPMLLVNVLGTSEGSASSAPMQGLLHKGPSPPLFPHRTTSPDYFNSHLQSSGGMDPIFICVHLSCSSINSPVFILSNMLNPLFLLQGFPVGSQPMLPEQFVEIHRAVGPESAAQQQVNVCVVLCVFKACHQHVLN